MDANIVIVIIILYVLLWIGLTVTSLLILLSLYLHRFSDGLQKPWLVKMWVQYVLNNVCPCFSIILLYLSIATVTFDLNEKQRWQYHSGDAVGLKGTGTPAGRTAVFTLSTFKGEAVVTEAVSMPGIIGLFLLFPHRSLSVPPSLSIYLVKENCLLATVEGAGGRRFGGFFIVIDWEGHGKGPLG